MKTGLILEGGAMRGMFTSGILDVMMEKSISFHGAIGVSAGAAFGCNYKSRQPGRAIRYNLRFSRDPRYCSFRSLLKTGDLFGAEFCYQEIPTKYDLFDYDAFRDSPMEFYVVATDVHTGKAVYHKCHDGRGPDMDWIRASASMPLVSRPVEIGPLTLLDGGIADSVPLRYFESLGYDRNIVILTQPEAYVKEKNKLLPLMRLSLRKYPKLYETLACRHEIYNETSEYIKKREKEGAILVLRPEKALEISRLEHDPKVLQAVYDTGRALAEKRLPEIETFLK